MHTKLWADAGYHALRIEAIAVDVARLSPSLLRLLYTVRGDIDTLVLPPPAPPFRTRDLWKTTCFEAFLKPAGGEAYREFNFAPSGQWAAYDFAAYRHGMVEAWLPAPPDIALTRDGDRLELAVTMSLDLPERSYRLALAVVVEERGGNISYWAANHVGDRPDFHHDACFVLELPAAEAA